jgi:hypothetical protein
MDTTNALASVDQLLALRMHLMCALTADKCGKDDVAYDMVSQAFVLCVCSRVAAVACW